MDLYASSRDQKSDVKACGFLLIKVDMLKYFVVVTELRKREGETMLLLRPVIHVGYIWEKKRLM